MSLEALQAAVLLMFLGICAFAGTIVVRHE